MHEQLSPEPEETLRGQSQDPEYEETVETHELYVGLTIRGLEAVFRIGAINATRTWRRLNPGTVPPEEPLDEKPASDS